MKSAPSRSRLCNALFSDFWHGWVAQAEACATSRWSDACFVFSMLGWMMIFALLALAGVIGTAVDGLEAASISLKLATTLFAVLFFLCVLARVARGRS